MTSYTSKEVKQIEYLITEIDGETREDIFVVRRDDGTFEKISVVPIIPPSIPVGEYAETPNGVEAVALVTDNTDQVKTGSLGVTKIRTRDEPWSNVLHPDFAVPQGGSANATSAIAAMEAQLTPGSTMYYPQGVYKATIAPTKSAIRWKGAGMWATTIIPTATVLDYMIMWGAVGASNVVFEDMAFDMSNATQGHLMFLAGLNGNGIVFRRCRFYNIPGYFGLVTGVDGLTIDSCLHHCAGNARGVGWSLGGGSRRIKFIGDNKFMYVGNGIGGQSAIEDLLVDGAHFDGGWWFQKSKASRSGAGITYTLNSITDPSGDFVSKGVSSVNQDNVRILTPLRTASTSVTFGIDNDIVDPGAGFITLGVSEGYIVRVAGLWAPVQEVLSETQLRVEGWYDNDTYLPSNRPEPGTQYTIYRVRLALVITVTPTVLTITSIFDLEGTNSIPADGTLYEIFVRPNYPLHLDGIAGGTISRVKVCNSTFLRGWSDQISMFSVSDAEIINNVVRRGQDYGMTLNDTPAIVMGNRVDRQGVVGIWSNGEDSEIIGNRLNRITYSNPVDSFICALLVDGDRSNVEANTMNGGNRTLSRYGLVVYGSGGAEKTIYIGRNPSRGHSVSDLRIGSDANPASILTARLRGWDGTISTDGTTGARMPPLVRHTTPAGFSGYMASYEKEDGNHALAITSGGLVTVDSLRHEGGSLALFGGSSATQSPDIPNTSGATLAQLEAEVNAIKDGVLRRYNLVSPPIPFDPTTIAGLAQWLSADGLSLSEGENVPSWTDLSGSGHHSLQPSSGAQPVYAGSVVNGKPVIRYDGVDDFTRATWSLVHPHTQIVVARYRSVNVGPLTYGYNGNPTGILTDGFDFKIYAGSAFISDGLENTLWHIHVATFNGASSRYRIDGGAGTGGNPGSLTGSGVMLATNTGAWAPVDIAECLIYDNALSIGDLNDLGEYLSTKYGLTWNPAT